MRVRFLRSIASFDWDYQAEQIADIDEPLARAWCASGVAEPVSGAAVVPETAMVAGPPETTMRVRGKGRRR